MRYLIIILIILFSSVCHADSTLGSGGTATLGGIGSDNPSIGAYQ